MDPTRLELTYRTISDHGGVERELPFAIAVIGDFAADAKFDSDASRQFVDIDADSFDRVMADICPELILRLGGRAAPALPEVMRLSFSALDEFRPESLVERIAPLKKMRDERNRMKPGEGAADQPPPPETGGGSLLDQVLDQSEPEGAPGGARPAPSGSGTRAIDAALASHLDAILHDENFQQLESVWLGLRHLVEHGGDRERVKIRLMTISKRDLLRNFETAPGLEDSILYREIFITPMAPPGGEPFGAVVADYAFSAHPDDLGLLGCLAWVAGIAHVPMLTAASPEILDREWSDYSGLAGLRSVTSHFDSPVYTKWRSFRESDDSRYVFLTLPRIRGRSPYGRASNPVAEFDYAEWTANHGDYLWINAAHAVARGLVDAFERDGWCTRLDGAGGESGALEAELGDALPGALDGQGFVCVQRRQPGEALSITTASAHKPERYHEDAATQTESLAARLPHVMACARIAHYLMRIAVENRPRINSATELVALMNTWLADYTAPADSCPLAEAEVELRKGERGNPSILIARLRPAFQLELAPLPIPLVIELPFDL
ncbi:MAG: type VI secretion system contractile sheath domain-containing protein [Alphaproteobacteria bacterium]